MLMGRHEYSLDAKSRTNFPAKFRAEMGPTLYITKWFDKCLVAYGERQWEQLDAKFENAPTLKSKDILRILYGNVAEVVPDKQGRYLLPQYLKDHAGITKDIIIIGARTYVEIWDKEAYIEYERNNNYSTIQAEMEEIGF